jgi:hypothetical protein
MTDIIDDLIKPFLDKGGLLVAVLLIVVSLAFNIYAAYNLDFLMKYGSREKSECGNEYMEIETPNYQIYNVIASPNTTYSSYMYDAFKYIQVAYITIFIAITFNILIDFGKIYRDRLSLNLTPYQMITAVIILALTIAGIISYLVTVYTPYINPMLQNFKTADIIIKKPDIKHLLGLYLTPIAFILPLGFIGYIAYTQPENRSFIFDKTYLTFVTLYIIIITISIKFNTSSLGVIGSIHSVYEPATENIKSNLNAILGTDVTTYPAMPPSTSSDQLKVFLIKNIKSIEKVDGDNFILQDYKDNLWKYLIHQNGKELEDIYKSASTDTTTKAITSIRSNMRILRNDTTIVGSLTGFTNITIQFAIIVFSLLVFAIFHLMYKHYEKPVTASIFIGSLALFLLILGPIYGWIMRVVSKNY